MTQNELYSFFEQLKEPLRQYKENKEKRMDLGFNVFHLISDYYYRETFHGDIIAALLSPDEKHGEGNLYIDLFIDMINEKKQLVNSQYYQMPKVNKEFSTYDGELSGRIDIIIEGDKHCIVVENKLNNAPDTYRQLPKYYRALKKRGITIDAFVYLPLDPNKEPNSSSWDSEIRDLINERLVIIPAYSAEHVNIVENWLTPAEERTSDDDARFIIRQYKSLLNNLTIDIMDNREIIDFLSRDDNFETTINILDLQLEFSRRIKDEFLDGIKTKLEEHGFEFLREGNKDKIEIKNSDYPSWRYNIERYGNSGWFRGLLYNGAQLIENAKMIDAWSHHPRNADYPLGWEYFEGKRDWNSLHTLREMKKGDFANEIVSEIEKAFFEIAQQGLPR